MHILPGLRAVMESGILTSRVFACAAGYLATRLNKRNIQALKAVGATLLWVLGLYR